MPRASTLLSAADLPFSTEILLQLLVRDQTPGVRFRAACFLGLHDVEVVQDVIEIESSGKRSRITRTLSFT